MGFHVNIKSKSCSLPYQSNQLQNVIATERIVFWFFWGLTLILTLDILFQMVALWNTVLLPPIFTTDVPGRLPPRVFDVQGQFTFSPYKAKCFDIHSGLPCRWRWGALPIHHSVTEYECYLEKEQGKLNVLFSIKDVYGYVSRLIAMKKNIFQTNIIFAN